LIVNPIEGSGYSVAYTIIHNIFLDPNGG